MTLQSNICRHNKWGLISKLLMRAFSWCPWIPGTLNLDWIKSLFKCAPLLANVLNWWSLGWRGKTISLRLGIDSCQSSQPEALWSKSRHCSRSSNGSNQPFWPSHQQLNWIAFFVTQILWKYFSRKSIFNSYLSWHLWVFWSLHHWKPKGQNVQIFWP